VQRYANVDGQKRCPFPKGRGTCPSCGGILIAKCGRIKAHHWAHDKRKDCDAWSEPIGPWHLWWQNLVRPEFAEVVRTPHRADIVGNGGLVVELQHSAILAEDIAAREAFYGDMVWLFNAAHRFAYAKSGKRAFFSLGRNRHLELCTKPVFLDFGFDLVEVERFTDAITMVSGFGLVLKRGTFTDNYLSDVRQPGSSVSEAFSSEGEIKSPWDHNSPVRRLQCDTNWRDSASGQTTTFGKWTEYIKVDYYSYRIGDSRNKRWDRDNVIDRHPEIANSWTSESLDQMLDFLCGTAVILGGQLRVLPSPAHAIPVKSTVSATESLLDLAEGHVRAGRLPILEEITREALLEKARQGEIRRYGQLLRPDTARRAVQRPLFE
jgi:hypothetical protein